MTTVLRGAINSLADIGISQSYNAPHSARDDWMSPPAWHFSAGEGHQRGKRINDVYSDWQNRCPFLRA